MSHSPAPWTFEYVGSSSAGDDGIDVYEVRSERTRIAENLNLADARLISCAPDMLACLRSILYAIEGNCLTLGDRRYIRNVILDATGEKA